jgi:hypothetical protein
MNYDDLYPDFVDTKDGRMAQFDLSEKALEKEKRKSVQVATFIIAGPWFGTYFKVWKSNLQKCIRRQDVEGAVVSMVAVGECGGQYLSNMINRLCKVMISEDIGVANFGLISECKNTIELYSAMRSRGFNSNPRENSKFKNDLINLVVKMAKSPKSRMVDTIVNHVNRNMGEEMEKFSGGEKLVECRQEFRKAVVSNDIEKMVMFCMALDRIGGQGVVSTGVYPKGYAMRLVKKRMRIYWVWLIIFEEMEKLKKDFIERRTKGEEESGKDIFELFTMVEDLCTIFCQHSGGGAILNIVHALFLLSFYKDKFLHVINLRESARMQELDEKEMKSWDKIVEEGTSCEIWPLSDSYDRHVGLKISEERKSLKFFFGRGAKLNGVPEWLEDIEDHFNNLLIYSLDEED